MARRPDNPRPGLVVIDKPAGMTSHDVVSRVRRLAHTRKVGHGGTLDPMATGVLVLGIGKATKLLTWVSGHSKEYRATIRFGISTNTDDAEGVATAAKGCACLSEADLEAVLAPLRGDIMQVPTTVSAIKVNGKRAYALARAGQDVELAARPVHISRLEVLAPPREAQAHIDEAGEGAACPPGPVRVVDVEITTTMPGANASVHTVMYAIPTKTIPSSCRDLVIGGRFRWVERLGRIFAGCLKGRDVTADMPLFISIKTT